MTRAHRYEATIRWTGAGNGPTATYESYSREYLVEIAGKAPLRASADAAFRGDPSLVNPEEMLVAALSACHMLSYLAEAARAGIAVVAYEDAAGGVMNLDKGGGRFAEVTLRPRVVVAPGADVELARRLHERAHAVCFIASSVNFPVRCEPDVRVA